MFFKVISKEIRVKGIDEPIYEVSYNDARHFYIRKSSYEKFNCGEIHFSCDTKGYHFSDKNGKKLKTEFGVY